MKKMKLLKPLCAALALSTVLSLAACTVETGMNSDLTIDIESTITDSNPSITTKQPTVQDPNYPTDPGTEDTPAIKEIEQKPRIELVGAFTSGLAYCEYGEPSGKYGYFTSKRAWIDVNGKIVLDNVDYSIWKDVTWGSYTNFVSFDDDTPDGLYNAKGELMAAVQDYHELIENDDGYYWTVESEEHLSGNIYKITCYDEFGTKKFSHSNIKSYKIFPFYYGRTILQMDDKAYLIDGNGNEIEADFSEIRKFYNDSDSVKYSIVSVADRSFTQAGNIIILREINSNQSYTERVYLDYQSLKVYSEPQNNILNYDIKSVPEFKDAKYSEHRISSDGKYVLVILTSQSDVRFYALTDRDGNIIMHPVSKKFSLEQVYTGNNTENQNFNTLLMDHCYAKDPATNFVGFIDTKGNWAISAQFDVIKKFVDGIAPAQDPETYKWGYIDTSGNWIVSPIYTQCEPFSGGYATAYDMHSQKIFVLDKSGKIIIEGCTR